MAKKLRVGLIFGGRSGEHEISLRSARSVIEAMDRDKYTVVPIAIDKEGKWLAPADAVRLLPEEMNHLLSSEVMEGANSGVAIIGDPSRRGLVALDAAGSDRPSQPLDVVFPVLHGTYGEDGTIQGLLEMAGVAYVGCGVLASSCGMDKVTMKALFRDAGLPLCRYTWFLRSEWESEPERLARRVARQLGFPCFVKPANLGSSVGISRASDKRSFERAVNLAARYDRKIIVEEAVDAREIECAVIGNDKPEASLPGEYVVHDEAARFLDYTEKYSSTGHVDFVVPAPLSKSLTGRLRRMATTAFKAVDGAGFARVDFFLRRDTGELIINELNTIPGLTDVSGYPKMWAASGLPFPQVIDRLIALALERHTEKARNQTSI
ncbi:MAG TPA: D-alanine--D-alanine ligase family protein [Pyrinomonadaceae bacterium]|jgi:D-alanine-D-alanine ligase|nr:D-alanine--D-alanine ligase family protein [Pyrinomonadaceae bacterium]